MQEGAEGPGKQWVRKKHREGGPAAREAPAVASEAQLHQQLTVPSPRFGCHARGREAAKLLLGFLREAALRPHSGAGAWAVAGAGAGAAAVAVAVAVVVVVGVVVVEAVVGIVVVVVVAIVMVVMVVVVVAVSREFTPATRTGTHRSLSGLKTPFVYAGGKKSASKKTSPKDRFSRPVIFSQASIVLQQFFDAPQSPNIA